jgi:26S proteasome regulatory subunit (ATPase 3-interacting protein)
VPFRDAGGETVEPMSQEEIKAIDEGFAKWRKIWVERRKVYKE